MFGASLPIGCQGHSLNAPNTGEGIVALVPTIHSMWKGVAPRAPAEADCPTEWAWDFALVHHTSRAGWAEPGHTWGSARVCGY